LPCTASSAAGEDSWLPAGLLLVATGDLGLEVGHGLLAYQCDDAAAPSCAGQSRSSRPLDGAGRLDQRFQFGAADVVVIAGASVGLVQEWPTVAMLPSSSAATVARTRSFSL